MADDKNDIEKYLKGELTPSQMHALEKRALSDPFLADALEGAQQLSPEDLLKDLHQLQNDLNKRVNKKDDRSWVWIGRIAAGLLLLAVSTFVVVFISNRTEKRETLALNKPMETTPPVSEKEESMSTSTDSVLSLPEETLSDEVAKTENRAQNIVSEPQPQPEKRSAPASVEKPKEDFADADKNTELPAVSAEKERIAENAEPGVRSEQAPALDSTLSGRTYGLKLEETEADDNSPDVAKRKKAAPFTPSAGYASDKGDLPRKVIRGKVTFADDGTGLPGVNVMIKGSNEGTVTDAQGNYQISVEGTQPMLTFSFIGFTSKEVFADGEKLDVQLDADVSELSEVVVIGYGADKVPSSSTPPVMELAGPEGGRKAFKQYLESNLRYPEEALKNQVEGKVTIQFSVGLTGQVTDFKVIRGIGFGCDEEVIRLIKAGPKWSPTKKNEEPIKDRVRVRMRFALPKK